MSSESHPGRADHRATHYCAAGIQTHLKMIAMDQDTIRFDVTSITNLAKPDGAHVHDLNLRWRMKIISGCCPGLCKRVQKTWKISA